MLIGSIEHIEHVKSTTRTKTAYDCEFERDSIDDMIWIKGKYVNIIDSHKLMQYMKSHDHQSVFHTIKKNATEANNFFAKYPDKRPADYYIKIEQNRAILDHETAKQLVKYFTGAIPDFEFIERDENAENAGI